MTTRFPKKILILGSGGLRIGQAGEFDYSGSQAIKALKEENIHTILVNPNIATVQTDPGMADTLYLLPLTLEMVTRVIEKEKPDGILLGFGGQTGLNLGLELEGASILKKAGVRVLGTPVEAIRKTEDRAEFCKMLQHLHISTPKSRAVTTVAEALKAAKIIGYPVMIRSGFSLGGLGSGIVKNQQELREKVSKALYAAPQILVEEDLRGWKEIEYEIVRDARDNTIAVCNMENMDPVGIHTGESIVVAPSQTLNNEEYHFLRSLSLRIARHLGIVGECNIQFALHPNNGTYRVIEMNARLSRSSALASKATGYPLAFVAAKLAIGKQLFDLKNTVTKSTSAFFEPALDYLVVKIPRWDMHKMEFADPHIGSEMKSVGEVMAIGRSFPEGLQKAIRMLGHGIHGLTDHPHHFEDPLEEIASPTDRRLFALADAYRRGVPTEEIHQRSQIDPWFLEHIKTIVQMDKKLKEKPMSNSLLRHAKQAGFSDRTISVRQQTTEEAIRKKRKRARITPCVKQIDTLGGEFPATTNYLYVTYHGDEDDIQPTKKQPIIIIGSGPYAIGSSVEFDWCAVNMARVLRGHDEQTIMINSNPETVSTDYDESDRLYFEELTEERIRDIIDFENPKGIVVSVGGQIANSLALSLSKRRALLGTSAQSIDMAENRTRFSHLLSTLGIDQPAWTSVSSTADAKAFAHRVGYPILVRPSYVLSGSAMKVIHGEEELETYITAAIHVSGSHPVIVTEFIPHAKELEIDGVANHGQIVIEVVSEHIEPGGVHSGDATVVVPPQRLYVETVRVANVMARRIVKALNISGPFNIQFLAKNEKIRVIECNVRASRSFPFISKVIGKNLIQIAGEVFLGLLQPRHDSTMDIPYVGVKSPQFSFQRMKGANPVARVEMASTGEVACIGRTYEEALLLSWLATDQRIGGKRILISIGGRDQKEKLLSVIQELEMHDWDISATEHTHAYLATHGIGSRFVYKMSDESDPDVRTLITNKKVDLIVNIPTHQEPKEKSDGYMIRRLAIDHHIPLITNLEMARVLLRAITTIDPASLPILSWNEYVEWMG